MTTFRMSLERWISGDYNSRFYLKHFLDHCALSDELGDYEGHHTTWVNSVFSTHGHPMSAIDGLIAALGGKSDVGHSHIIADVAALQDALDGKSDIGHTHDYGDLDGLPSLFSGSYDDLDDKPSLFDGDYDSLINKPTIPAAQVNADWSSSSGVSQILNKPSSFPASAHSHIISDVTNLQTELDGKIPKNPKAASRANVATGTSGLAVTIIGLSVISAAALTRLDEYGAAINDILARLRSREIIAV